MRVFVWVDSRVSSSGDFACAPSLSVSANARPRSIARVWRRRHPPGGDWAWMVMDRERYWGRNGGGSWSRDWAAARGVSERKTKARLSERLGGWRTGRVLLLAWWLRRPEKPGWGWRDTGWRRRRAETGTGRDRDGVRRNCPPSMERVPNRMAGPLARRRQ